MKAEAYLDGVFVTIAVVNIKVTKNRNHESRQFNSSEIVEEKNIETSIFPNPSTGIVNIDLRNVQSASVKVYGSNGIVLYQQNGISGIYQFELLGTPGMYFVEITTEEGSQIFKLIKE